MFRQLRAGIPALMIAVLVLSLAAAPVSAAQSPSTAEAGALELLSQKRRDVGNVPLRWDRRLADIAQERSGYMAETGDFSHPPMSELADRLAEEGIKWSYLGETIAWNSSSTALNSAANAIEQSRNSAPHWDMLGSNDFNYVAIGVARASNGRYYWTALIIRGPDRTNPKASMVDAKEDSASGGKRKVTISWTGRDVKLAVLTAGLKDFRLQRRVGSGAWKTVTNWTTATSRSFELTVGKTYRFRIRARDHNGNRSVWSEAITVKP